MLAGPGPLFYGAFYGQIMGPTQWGLSHSVDGALTVEISSAYIGLARMILH
jgi:hypothetical protein